MTEATEKLSVSDLCKLDAERLRALAHEQLQDGAARSSTNTPSGKPAGKPQGAPGYGRVQKLAVTDTAHHYPTHCAHCGHPLVPDPASPIYAAWEEIDIAEKVEERPALNLKVTRHQMHALTCTCGHSTQAKTFVAQEDPLWDKVAIGEWRLIGPRLAALIVSMAFSMRLSRARIRCFFDEILDLQLSTGVINNTILDKLRALVREFLNDWEAILRQVAQPYLPLTNHVAEQILRHWVIARKLSQGTRSEAGTRVVGILASVIATCRARNASPWRFLVQVIGAARIGAELPAMPVIPVGE